MGVKVTPNKGADGGVGNFHLGCGWGPNILLAILLGTKPQAQVLTD